LKIGPPNKNFENGQIENEQFEHSVSRVGILEKYVMWRYVCSKHSLRIFCFKRKLLYRSLSAMKVPTKKRALSFLPIIASLTEIACTCELAYAEKAQPSKDVFPNGTHFSPPQNNTPPWSDVFPSLNDVVSMARLSGLVYEFRDAYNFTCADFIPAPGNYTEDITCEWYTHSYTLGTQVLLVSNRKEKYIAVIFAGTDDLRTFLEDTNMITKPFGNNSTVSFTNETDHRYENVKVHGGFNNAVFTHDIWEQIYSKTQDLLQKYPSYRLWTTGHSLGAANAILTATAFASVNHDRKVLCVNFGCPRTGNRHWRDYFNSTSPLSDNLSIWRVVLSWDLIPRLPHFFYRKLYPTHATE